MMQREAVRSKVIAVALASALGIVVLVAGVLLFSDIFLQDGNLSFLLGKETVVTPPIPQQPRILAVTTGVGGDFPGKEANTEEQRRWLAQCVDFAANNGYDTILFEAIKDENAYYTSKMITPYHEGQSHFDPLAYLTKLGQEAGISIATSVNLFTFTVNAPDALSLFQENPDWQGSNTALNIQREEVRERGIALIKEISQNYGVSAILLDGLDNAYFSSFDEGQSLLLSFFSEAKQALHRPKEQGLGMFVQGESILSGSGNRLSTAILQKGLVDYVLPRITALGESAQTVENLSEELALWEALCGQYDALSVPIFDAGNASGLLELSGTMYQGAVAVSGYTLLSAEPPVLALTTRAILDSPSVESTTLDLSTFPKVLSVTRPEHGTILDSSWESYFIAGTSVPGEEITIDGQIVQTDAKTGLWGHLVSLETGENTFTVQQGEKKETISITRQKQGVLGTIKTFRSGTLKPSVDELVFFGDRLPLSCTAPYGASISASLGGLTVSLEPVSSASPGTPVSFTGSLDVSSLTSGGQVKNLGQVTYTLRYNGNTGTEKSAGEVFAAGKDAVAVGAINNFGGMVNRNPINDGDYISILRDGCVDKIVENTGAYYGLSSGGYIVKDAINLLEGMPEWENQISTIRLEKTEKGEKLHITGSKRPTYTGEWQGDTLTFTVFNSTGWENVQFAALSSDLYSNLSTQKNEDGSITLTFTFPSSDTLWGWDVAFVENTMTLYLKRPPQVDWNSSNPLSQVDIALDPGHGGTDIGAQGVPGNSGPAENLFNLANAYVLKTYLEALGANVSILQEDTDSSLNNRLRLAQNIDADFFISIHHNSVSAIYDSNTVSGVEVYYWNDTSQGFANAIAQGLTSRTGQKLRNVEQTYYRVTMMNSCPAVLVESGFLCNPSEYAMLSTPEYHGRYAAALTEAILQSLPWSEADQDSDVPSEEEEIV